MEIINSNVGGSDNQVDGGNNDYGGHVGIIAEGEQGEVLWIIKSNMYSNKNLYLYIIIPGWKYFTIIVNFFKCKILIYYFWFNIILSIFQTKVIFI